MEPPDDRLSDRICAAAQVTRARRASPEQATRKRLSVFRSSKHIYAQVIDDDAGTTLAAASSTR